MTASLLEAMFGKFEKYQKWLERQNLSDQTRRAYVSRVNGFLGYLGSTGEDLKALVANDHERKYVLRQYKRHMKLSLKLGPATVNANLTAIDHFMQFAGAPSTDVGREDLPQQAPRALSKQEQQLFLRAVAGCRRNKDRAILLLLYFSGIRISECANLNVDDVSVIGRSSRIIVRDGKGGRYREIPLHRDASLAVKIWLDERMLKFEENDKIKKVSESLFLNPQGQRLSTASIDLIVRKVGTACGLDLSAHVLRHTCLTNLVRNPENDLVLVAEIGGHKRLETTRRYALPTFSDKELAVEKLSDR